MAARGWGRGGESRVNGDGASVWDEEKVLAMDGGKGCMTLSMCSMAMKCILKMAKMTSVVSCMYFSPLKKDTERDECMVFITRTTSIKTLL